MMRVLEFIVALIIVVVVGVVVGVVMPSSGHVERSLTFGKDMRQVYDLLDNFRRFPEYTVLRQYDANTKFTLAGKPYGPGAQISWSGNADKVGDGKLTIAKAEPNFDKIDTTVKKASIVWDLTNSWRGNDKRFTLDVERQGSRGQITKVTWNYDVSYGFNLIDRYSNLYIHGNPDAFIQFSLANLQNVLATVQNVDYSKLIPYVQQTQPTPMLLVSTQIARSDGLAGLDEATGAAVKQIQDAAKKLKVNITGPRVIFTTNYGDQNYTFDVGMPIDATSLNVGGQDQQLAAPTPPKLDAAGQPVDAASTAAPANAASVAGASSAAAPATAGSAGGAPAAPALEPGSKDRYGRLVVDGNVRAALMYGGPTLKGIWTGTAAGVPQTRDMLKAYAMTHGYKFDEVTNRLYDIEVQPEVKDDKGNVTTYAKYEVYLPITDAPEQTPEQEAGLQPPTLTPPPAASTAAPASSASAGAPASSASAAAPADANAGKDKGKKGKKAAPKGKKKHR